MTAEDASKLFVAGLPDEISEETLRDLFTSAGSQVEELTIPRDRATGRIRGFAFVRLGSPQQADAVRNVLDGTLVGGRSISVRAFSASPPARGERRPPMSSPGAAGGGPDTSDRTLYVGNLPYDVSEEEVTGLFTGAGGPPPQRLHLPMGPDGRRRGFGFATFETAAAANDALSKVRDAAVRGRRCIINLAQPRGERPPRSNPDPRPGPRGDWGGDGAGAAGDPPPASGAGGPFASRPSIRRPRREEVESESSRAAKNEGRRRSYEERRQRRRGHNRWEDDDDDS